MLGGLPVIKTARHNREENLFAGESHSDYIAN
jgi:hypothetical protein